METLTIDTARMSDAALVRWAKRRIAADAHVLTEQLGAAELLEGADFDAGLHFDMGIVMLRDRGTDTVYALAPSNCLVGQTGDGREVLYRDGESVDDLAA